MKKMKFILILFILIPNIVFAYSNELILGGENVGIHVNTNGIMIIGFYKVNGKVPVSNPEIKIGDYIIEVNSNSVNNIKELQQEIEKNINNNIIELTIKRENEIINTKLEVVEDNNSYKTGLYVKDGLTGLGTLTYIDPNTKIFGALGHEIIESTSKELVEVKTGNIFETNITGIRKSSNGDAGEKNATFNYENIYGDIKSNTIHGIFGTYLKPLNGEKLLVAKEDEVKLGEAYIYTTINRNNVEAFPIEIIKLNLNKDVKNILFTVKSDALLNKTGGIVQGMSGSPIVQNNKIIGAVTHVIVDNPKMGYGIYIKNMLEEGERQNKKTD